MIIYNNSTNENIKQFITDTTPNSKQLIEFINNGIIKIDSKCYISDSLNILDDTPIKAEYKNVLSMLTNLYEIDIDNCVMTHKQWINQIAMALTHKDYYNELVSDYKEYREFCEA
tara:strand:- start:148 stop:492 length:345 start_codon:yes stop_codon:yes gene_type:complete